VGFAVTLSVLGKLWVPVEILKLCTLGSLDVVPGESSTLTLFLRVMETFDDDDDEQQQQQQQQQPLSLLVIYI
jgi:hypothetical protein